MQWSIGSKTQFCAHTTFSDELLLFSQPVQSLSHVRLLATLWTVARQASLSITNSRSLLKLVSLESVMPSNHLILCRPLLLLPSNFPSIRVFSNESVLRIRWPKYWSFTINPCCESFRTDWLDLLAFLLCMLDGRARGCWVVFGSTEQVTCAPTSRKKGSPLSTVKGTHKGCPGQRALPSPHRAESMRVRHGDPGGGDPQSPFTAVSPAVALASPQL